MRLTELEERVRGIAWPEPSADVRARVLTDAPVAGEPVVWRARVAKDAPGGMAVSPVASGWRWRRAAWMTTLCAVVVVGSCTGLDTLAGQQVEAEIARLEARYGSLALRTLTVPPVPAEDNRALVVKAAAATIAPLAAPVWNSGFRIWVTPWGEPRAFAEANQVAVRMAAGVRSRRQSNWEVDYAGGKGFPADEPIRMLAHAISTTSLMQLDTGHADEASATIAVGLGVTASLRQEPALVAQYIRANDLGRQQFMVIREIVTRSDPSAHALDDLAWWLAENRAPDPGLVATLGTLKQANAIFARMANGDIDPDLAVQIYPSDWPSLPPQYLGLATRLGRPLVRRAQSRYLHEMGVVLAVLTAPPPRGQVPWHLSLERGPVEQLMHPLTDRFTDHRSWQAWNSYTFMSSLAATEVAVALRRFKINNGGYPDDLDPLVPLYLNQLPIEPSTGRPPIYARQGAGFTLRANGHVGAANYSALEWNVAR